MIDGASVPGCQIVGRLRPVRKVMMRDMSQRRDRLGYESSRYTFDCPAGTNTKPAGRSRIKGDRGLIRKRCLATPPDVAKHRGRSRFADICRNPAVVLADFRMERSRRSKPTFCWSPRGLEHSPMPLSCPSPSPSFASSDLAHSLTRPWYLYASFILHALAGRGLLLSLRRNC
jgi:hypothetical protein